MNIIDRLEAEWRTLRDAPVMAAALANWRAVDPRLGFGSLPELVTAVECRDDEERADGILAALVGLAGGDDCAARVVLQLLLPGCKAMMRGIPRRDADERTAVVAAALFDRIRTYPLDRRPHRIAGNILMDVRHRLLRWEADRRTGHASLDRLPEWMQPTASPPEQAAEAVALLDWAVRRGHLDRESARLIALTRLGGRSVASVAAAHGLNEQSLRRRRQRAEQRLRAAALTLA
ncbi:MAG TPA: hypothetical protein VI916_12080 [Acidimicrobiia bacterium]|nr:hypothetical protein [Acidimicrobiia bacterium]